MDNTPDFDKMSPEEIMTWMESLAKRQGVSQEQLVTKADVDIPEIDPDSVVIDEPGYVPYGEETKPKPPKEAAPPKAAPVSPQPAVVSPPPPKAAPPPAPPPPRAVPPVAAPPPPPVAVAPPPPPPAAVPQPVAESSDSTLDWLAGLAADQPDFNLDLSALTAEIGGETTSAPAASEPALANPEDWLGNLTSNQGEVGAPSAATAPEPAAEVTDPFASGIDPMAWLESLAKRQGAKSEELTTAASINVPVPENPVINEPGYTAFSFDAPSKKEPAASKPPAAPKPPAKEEAPALDNPAAWLDSLAASQGFDAETITPKAAQPEWTIAEVERAIAAGTVTPDQMRFYLEHQTDKFVEQMSEPVTLDYDPDAPAVRAELPDWLLEQVGAPPAGDEGAKPPAGERPALIDAIVEPPAVADMPEWLREDVQSPDTLDLESIFASEDDEHPTTVTSTVTEPAKSEELAYQIEVDPSDPWVEAFDLEHDHGMEDISTIPDWYARNLNDPRRIAEVERMAHAVDTAGGAPELRDEPLLAEAELAAGQPEELPDWLREAAPEAVSATAAPPAAEAAQPTPTEDIPDWLKEAASPVTTEEVPAWLIETISDQPQEEIVLPPAQEAAKPPPVVSPPPPPKAPAAAPKVAAVPKVTAAPKVPAASQPAVYAQGTLDGARSKLQSGDLEGSLAEYEGLVRASAQLEETVSDLQTLAEANKGNPAIYRVLGDGLMRQGKLQDALDIYREALNQL